MHGQEPEDRLIRTLVLLGTTAVVVGLLTLGMAVTVMVGANFNILQWME